MELKEEYQAYGHFAIVSSSGIRSMELKVVQGNPENLIIFLTSGIRSMELKEWNQLRLDISTLM